MQKRHRARQSIIEPAFAQQRFLSGAHFLEVDGLDSEADFVAAGLYVDRLADRQRGEILCRFQGALLFRSLEGDALVIVADEGDAVAVDVLLADFIGEHGHGDGLFLAIRLKPYPDAIAADELIEPPPPAMRLDLGIGGDRPYFRQFFALDQQRDTPVRRIDGLERGEVFGH